MEAVGGMWDTLPWCRGQTGSSRDGSVGNQVGSLQVVQTELPPPCTYPMPTQEAPLRDQDPWNPGGALGEGHP